MLKDLFSYRMRMNRSPSKPGNITTFLYRKFRTPEPFLLVFICFSLCPESVFPLFEKDVIETNEIIHASFRPSYNHSRFTHPNSLAVEKVHTEFREDDEKKLESQLAESRACRILRCQPPMAGPSDLATPQK